jgi:hypothetical protein
MAKHADRRSRAVYRVTAVDPGLAAFWQHWLALPFWPSGPPWFLWVLLVFNLIAADSGSAGDVGENHLGMMSLQGHRIPRMVSVTGTETRLSPFPCFSIFRASQFTSGHRSRHPLRRKPDAPAKSRMGR